VLKLTALDLDEIATALADQSDYEHCRLINTTTGELVYWTRDTGIDGHHPIDLDDLDPDLLGIDPLPHLASVFGLDDKTAIRYANAAKQILQTDAEQHATNSSRQSATVAPDHVAGQP
jgi:hypothetical protein